jgi:eukaryotic-like serine/threonine-protein kinase
MNQADRKSIGPYLVRRKLADGGMGQIYLAARPGQDDCVLKTIRSSLAEDPRYVEMFLREAKVTALLDHPNVVRIVNYDTEPDGELYLAMEYIEGWDLSQILKRSSALNRLMPCDTALHIAIEVLKGLQYAHEYCDQNGRSMGIVHRDLSPNNILVSRNGDVKITDFGIAKTVLSVTSNPRDLKGKFHYLSPEQIDGAQLDARSDIFTIGIVLYEMIVGRRPFEAESISVLLSKILRGEHEPFPDSPDLPKSMKDIILKAVAKAPEDRFPTAAAMRKNLEMVLGETAGAETTIRDYCIGLFENASSIMADVSDAPLRPNDETHTGFLAREKASPPPPRRINFKMIPRAGLALMLLSALALLIVFRIRPESIKPAEEVISHTPSKTSETASPSPSLENLPITEKTPAQEPRLSNENPAKPGMNEAKKTNPAQQPDQVKDGFLAVGDLAPFAHVYIDGQYKDDTPTKMIALAPGAYKVKLYNPKIKKSALLTVQVEAGEVFPISSWP